MSTFGSFSEHLDKLLIVLYFPLITASRPVVVAHWIDSAAIAEDVLPGRHISAIIEDFQRAQIAGVLPCS